MLPTGGSKMSEPNVRLLVRDAVDQKADGLLAIAGGVERERADAANRPRREPGLRRRHRSGHEQAEIDEVAAVQRNLLDGL